MCKGYIRASKEKCQPIPPASRPGEQKFSGDLPLAVHQGEDDAALGTACSANLCQHMAPGPVRWSGWALDFMTNLLPERVRREDTAEHKATDVRGNV